MIRRGSLALCLSPPPAARCAARPRARAAAASTPSTRASATAPSASGRARRAVRFGASRPCRSAAPALRPPARGAPTPRSKAQDFADQARLLFRVAACGPTGEVPARFDAAVVPQHCDELGHAYGEYRKAWVDVAKPFIAALRPKDLPATVVYPFGGGDFVSALATFPDADRITTISLEPAGDVRPIDRLPADSLAHELAVHRAHLERLFEKAHSRTDNLEKESKTDLPGEILFALAALVVHGDEPVSLRYFRLGPDGTLAYVTQADIDAATHNPASGARSSRTPSCAFAVPATPTRRSQVLRHISFNLDDAHLKADPALLAHLTREGEGGGDDQGGDATCSGATTSRSSGAGWSTTPTGWSPTRPGFPRASPRPAGFVQDTYGTSTARPCSGLPTKRDAEDLKRLFASEPTRDLAFRYGYPDRPGTPTCIVTRREANAADGNAKTPPPPAPAPSR